MENLYFTESGRKRRAERAACIQCGKEFLRRLNPQRGKPRLYCSKQCAAAHRRNRISVVCFNCKKVFDRAVSKVSLGKHGIDFCSRKCKDEAQSLSGSCLAIRPSHYGTANKYQRYIGGLTNACCTECGDDRRYVLTLHHVDGNSKNNPADGSNWEVVCQNCHAKRHLKFVDGRWMYSTTSLTPRHMLPFL